MSGVIHPAWAEDQLDAMFSFLMMGEQKANVPLLVENLERLRRMLIQKTGGQKQYAKKDDVSFDDLWTVCNIIVIETMALYLSGGLKEGAERACRESGVRRAECADEPPATDGEGS